MKRSMVSVGLVCVALMGCGGGGGGPRVDGGGIVLMDSGPPPVGTDSGPPVGRDAGPPPAGSCSVAGATGYPALPAGCLPRCSTATATAVMACMTNACVDTALMADTSPATTIDYGMGMTDTLDCGGCYNWQITSCVYDSCPSELGAYFMCAQTAPAGMAMTACASEYMAVDSCITANQTAFQSCAGGRVGMCFGTVRGFAPGLRPQTVSVDTADAARIATSSASAYESIRAAR